MSRINILCFGDSNTYGYIPDGSGRFDESVRWTGLLQKRLGQDFHVIEEGLCGRTTVFQDALREGRRGVDLIGTLVESHNPIDILVVMLGTNDCKTRYGASAGTIAKGMEQVIEQAKTAAQKSASGKIPQVLMISPILLGKGVGEEGYDTEFDEKSEYVSTELANAYRKVADRHQYFFLNAADVASPSITDREHLDQEGHAALADAVYEKIQLLSA